MNASISYHLNLQCDDSERINVAAMEADSLQGDVLRADSVSAFKAVSMFAVSSRSRVQLLASSISSSQSSSPLADIPDLEPLSDLSCNYIPLCD